MEEIIIYRYLAGKTTEEEKSRLLAWLKASAENRRFFAETKAIWQARQTQRPEMLDCQKSLARLNRRIDTFQSASATISTIFHRHLYCWATIAAVFFLLIGIGYHFLPKFSASSPSDDWISFWTGPNEKVTVLTLPDSTRVWLDKNTSLKYPAQFTESERNIEVKGIAFFEVKKDAAHPFIVRTDRCKIKVLGTSFHIDTESHANRIETILVNGSVQLLNGNDRPVAVLRPGQQALYFPESDTAEIRDVAASELTSWRFELVSFTNQPVDSLIHALQEAYDIRIEMDAAPLQGRLYNFTFKRSNDAETSVRQLSYITGLPARILLE